MPRLSRARSPPPGFRRRTTWGRSATSRRSGTPSTSLVPRCPSASILSPRSRFNDIATFGATIRIMGTNIVFALAGRRETRRRGAAWHPSHDDPGGRADPVGHVGKARHSGAAAGRTRLNAEGANDGLNDARGDARCDGNPTRRGALNLDPVHAFALAGGQVQEAVQPEQIPAARSSSLAPGQLGCPASSCRASARLAARRATQLRSPSLLVRVTRPRAAAPVSVFRDRLRSSTATLETPSTGCCILKGAWTT